ARRDDARPGAQGRGIVPPWRRAAPVRAESLDALAPRLRAALRAQRQRLRASGAALRRNDVPEDHMNETAQRWTLAIAAHVALIVAWYLFVKLGNVPKFVMPSPGATLDALLQPNYSWWTNIAVTGTEIFAGYFLALVVGVGLAMVFTWSKMLESFFMPLLVSLNMIPKVALGPLIIVWFKYGVFPNTVMAFSICVFPILLT